MIDLTISNSSIAGRPPNSDFLIGFWPGENWSIYIFFRKISKTKFCQMIENAISNSSIAGRPPNS